MEDLEDLKMATAVQNVAQLYSMLRSQAFDLHEPNPRMLPRQFNPVQLNVECAAASPIKQAVAPTKRASGKRGSKKQAGTAR